MVLVLHPVGNQNVRALVSGLQKHQMLESFHTSIAWRGTAIDNFIPNNVLTELKRREFLGIDSNLINSYPFTDICRLISIKIDNKLKIKALSKHFHPETTYDYVDKRTAKYIEIKHDQIHLVYGYDDKCLSSFRMAKSKNIKLIYEAAFAYAPFADNIMCEEQKIEPEWAGDLNCLSSERLQKQEEELELADHIVVASSYAKKTLPPKFLSKKISVIPYGAPETISEESLKNKRYDNKKLRVLYVGSLIQQKGISYLFNAVDKLGDIVELNIIGSPHSNVTSKKLEKHLSAHNWIPSLSNSKVLEYMYNSDVLILPSLAEAFGLVLLEALSRGLPVIASEHTGAPDIITNGKEGFIVPIRDSDAIANHINFLNSNRDELEKMSKYAWLRACELTWESYQKTALNTLNNYL
jgi:alpha-maltose-1-phosphate synthase